MTDAQATTDVQLLGHTFKSMIKTDYDSFADAQMDSFICYLPDRTLLWDPTYQTITEVYKENNTQVQRAWTLVSDQQRC